MTQPDEVPPHGWWGAGIVAGVGLFSAAWRIDLSDWKLDEQAYAQAGWSLVHQGIDTNRGHPPLAKLLFGGAQVLFGRDLAAVRTVSAVGLLVSMAVLFAFGRRIGGWWTGVAAAGLYAVLPRSMVVGGWSVADVRIERYGMLEVVAAPLLLAGVWFGWRWILGDGRRWALASGALLGLAAASKLNAAVALVPVVAAALALRWGRPRLRREALGLCLAAAGAFLVPFVVFGRRAGAQIAEVFRFPAERADSGHLLVLGRDVYDHSPWWAHLRYQWDADGPLLVLAVVLGLALAVRSRRRLVVSYLGAVLMSLVGTALLAPVALPHYRAMWLPLVVLLVAVGITDALAGWGPVPGTPARAAAAWRWTAVVVAAVLVVSGAIATAHVATLGEGDYQRLAQQAVDDGVKPQRIVVYGDSVAPYFPGSIEALAPFDDGSIPAQMVVLDPSLSDAVTADVVERWRGWARTWGLEPHRVGRLEGWWAS